MPKEPQNDIWEILGKNPMHVPKNVVEALQYLSDRITTLGQEMPRNQAASLSPRASDIDPYLPDLYWKFFSGIYSDTGSEIGHSDRMTLSHDGALLMTKRFRKEMLDVKRNDEETSGD